MRGGAIMSESERKERIKQLYDELMDNTHSDWHKHQQAFEKRRELQAEIRVLCEEDRRCREEARSCSL